MDFKTTVATKKPQKLESIGEGFFGAQLATYGNGYRAVIKNSRNKDKRFPERTKFRGINLKTTPHREIAFYALAKILGWGDLVPETVEANPEYFMDDVRADDMVSAQEFVPSIYMKDIDPRIVDKSNPNWIHYFRDTARKFPKHNWQKLILLDLIGNSRDRHNKNIIVKFPGPHLVAIDNSISLGLTFSRYRCTVHHYLFPKLFNFVPYRKHLESFKFSDFEPLVKYLRPLEVEHIYRRIEFLLKFPYRIPFNTMCKGNYGVNEFPDYKEFFKIPAYHTKERPLVIYDDGSREENHPFKMVA